MDYKNEICAGCGKVFEDGDDIVVCPECGTPQHRECYNKENRCVNASLHSQDFSWQSTLKENIAEPSSDENQNRPSQGNTVPLFDFERNSEQLEEIIIGGLGETKDREFDGIKVADAAIYLQTGAKRYIDRFLRAFSKNRKISWNWGAFFLAPAWFFYRRLIKAGLVFLAAVVAIQLFLFPVTQKAFETFDDITLQMQTAAEGENAEQAMAELSTDAGFLAKEKTLMKQMAILFSLSFLLPNVAAALSADAILRRKMKTDIENAKHDAGDVRTEKFLIMQKGGVSVFLFFAAFFAQQYLASVLIEAGNFILELFK